MQVTFLSTVCFSVIFFTRLLLAFDILSYANMSTTSSGEIILVVEDMAKDASSGLKIVNMDRGLAYRKNDIYLLTKEPKAIPFLEASWSADQKIEKQYDFVESYRSCLLVHPGAPAAFLKAFKEKIKNGYTNFQGYTRYWNGITYGEVTAGELKQSAFKFARMGRSDWRVDREWHVAFYLTYELEFNGQKVLVTALPKEFGGLWRTLAVLKKAKAAGPGKKLLIGTGGITPTEGDESSDSNTLAVLSELGTQWVSAGYQELLGFKNIEQYVSRWEGKPPIRFLSANVYGKVDNEEKRLFSPYEVIEVEGKKVAIIGLTSPSFQAEIEKSASEHSWLQGLLIKDPAATALEIFKEIRTKVDLIVMVSNLYDEEFGTFAKDGGLEGFDIIVRRNHRVYTAQSERKATAAKYFTRMPRWPLFEIYTRPTVVADTRLAFVGQDLTIYGREIVLDQKISSDGESVDDGKELTGIFSSNDIVLPDHRKLYPDKVTVPEEDFANMAAELLRRELSAEIGIFNIQPQRSDMTGELDSSIIKTWIRAEENLSIAYLSGADLLALQAANTLLVSPYRLAFAGLDAQGRIGDIPVQPNEIYRVATSTAVTENSEKYPAASASKQKFKNFVKVQGRWQEHTGGVQVSLIDFLIEALRGVWKNGKALGETEMLESYRSLYEAKVKNHSGYWVHDFKSIRFEYSQAKTTDLTDFQNVVDSRLQPTDQTMLGGGLAYTSVYRKSPYISEFGIKGSFAKLNIIPDENTVIENVLADDLVFFANTGWPVVSLKSMPSIATQMGPVFELAYDTEFEKDSGQDLEKSVQGFLGWRFYDGQILRSSTVALMNDVLLRSTGEKSEWGVNVRMEVAYPFLAGLANWRSELDYRYFFDADNDSNED